MRIDGFASAYAQPRSAPRSEPRDAAAEEQRERASQPAATEQQQGFDAQEIQRRVNALSKNQENLPTNLREATLQRPLSNRAAQALASYGSTAQITGEADASRLAGLDLYA